MQLCSWCVSPPHAVLCCASIPFAVPPFGERWRALWAPLLFSRVPELRLLACASLPGAVTNAHQVAGQRILSSSRGHVSLLACRRHLPPQIDPQHPPLTHHHHDVWCRRHPCELGVRQVPIRVLCNFLFFPFLPSFLPSFLACAWHHHPVRRGLTPTPATRTTNHGVPNEQGSA